MSALAMLSEGEEEVELSLGLSIGGCFRKPVKTAVQSVPTTSVTLAGAADVVFKNPVVSSPRSFEMDQGTEQQLPRSDASTLVDAESSAADGLFKRKKELHALRRQEARKKREEKQQKKGLCRRIGFLANGGAVADRQLLDAQELQCRLRDRAVKEIEASWADNRVCKKDKESGGVSTAERNVMSVALNRNQHSASNPNTTSSSSSAPFPVMPMQQYPFQPVQYMPYGNGLSFPYMVSCWGSSHLPPPTSSGEGLGGDKNIFQPLPLRPFASASSTHNGNPIPGDMDPNCGKGTSSGSQGSSASLLSDSQSASLQGRSCSETKSYRSRSPAAEQTDAKSQSEYGDSTPQNDVLQTEELTDNLPVPNTSRGRTEESTVAGPSSSIPSKSPSRSKPAAPEEEKEPPRSPLLAQMPCVSTTGNGPNGKTITGFLYRYTKAEVSIVCVCHGTSFSPAEFVKHAGGTDVSHPLKHIIVVPPAFG